MKNNNEDKPKVLIAGGGVKDFSPAEEFGEIEFITFSTQDIRNINRYMDDSVRIVGKLDRTPYIVVSGHAVFTLTLVLASYEIFGEAQILVYDFRKKKYNERSVIKAALQSFCQRTLCEIKSESLK